jgi:hypothetical protein
MVKIITKEITLSTSYFTFVIIFGAYVTKNILKNIFDIILAKKQLKTNFGNNVPSQGCVYPVGRIKDPGYWGVKSLDTIRGPLGPIPNPVGHLEVSLLPAEVVQHISLKFFV